MSGRRHRGSSTSAGSNLGHATRENYSDRQTTESRFVLGVQVRVTATVVNSNGKLIRTRKTSLLSCTTAIVLITAADAALH